MTMINKKHKFSILITLLMIIAVSALMTSCTASYIDVKSCVDKSPCGFWYGLWHGVISPFSFIVSLFDNDVTMYAVNNKGRIYDFGFVLGSGILFRLSN